jgi:hypothetical protein
VGLGPTYNKAVPLFVVSYSGYGGLDTSSPGGKHRQEVLLWGPVQRRRECGTLADIALVYYITEKEVSNEEIGNYIIICCDNFIYGM